MELDAPQDAFELLAGVEAGQNLLDLAGPHGFGGVGSVRAGAQPEAAEVAQLHDIASGQLLGNHGEQGLDHRNGVHPADGGELRDLSGQLAHSLAPTGLNGRIKLLGGCRVGWVATGYDVEFDGHVLPPV